jgi:hypothetical protein
MEAKKLEIKIFLHWVLFGLYLFLICFFLAKLEIQIEGPNGWAAKLPTWRITDPRITWVFGGRPITGFHFPLFFTKFSLVIETKILYCFSIMAVVWDFLWFVLNPSFGLQKYTPDNVWWFKKWALGFPVDYYVGILISLFIFVFPALIKKTQFKYRFLEWTTMTVILFLSTFIVALIVNN